MKRSIFWAAALLIISLTGCTGAAKKEANSEVNQSKITTENSVKEEKKSTDQAAKKDELDNLEKITFPGLDFSEVTYLASDSEKDAKIEEVFTEFYGLERGVDKVRYYYNRIDLNGDGNPETFVYLVGPAVSGSGGSSALILESDGDEYKVFSNFTLVRTPVIVSENKSNGWNDLIMYVSGGGAKPLYHEMKFDGEKYPLNPSVQPIVEEGTKIKGTAIIADDMMKNFGIEFK